MQRSRILQSLVFCLLVGLVGGCVSDEAGSPDMVPVSGKVTMHGEPLEGVFISFIPVHSGDLQPGDTTDAEGRFELETWVRGAFDRRLAGAPVGEYRVQLQWLLLPDGSLFSRDPSGDYVTAKAEESLSVKFSDPAQLTLKATIPEGGRNDFYFDVGDESELEGDNQAEE